MAPQPTASKSGARGAAATGLQKRQPAAGRPRVAGGARATEGARGGPTAGAVVWGGEAKVLSHVAELTAMGFSEEAARQALAEHAWDVNKALDGLLSQGGVPGALSGVGRSGPGALADGAWPDASFTRSAKCNGLAVALPGSAEAKLEGDLAAGKGFKWIVEKCSVVEAEAEHSEIAGQSPRTGEKQISKVEDSVPEHVPADWQALFGAPETALEVAVGAGLPTIGVLRTASTAMVQASEAVLPLARERMSRNADAASSPCKELRRVSQPWSQDGGSDQLGVQKGGFLLVWRDTKTEEGWIYAEELCDSCRAGWVPSAVLETSPPGWSWMRATRSWRAVDDKQVSVQKDDVLLVYVESRTDLGWTFVETTDVGDENAKEQDQAICTRVGWVPDYCLQWPTA